MEKKPCGFVFDHLSDERTDLRTGGKYIVENNVKYLKTKEGLCHRQRLFYLWKNGRKVAIMLLCTLDFNDLKG